jgi:hypothetical protein
MLPLGHVAYTWAGLTWLQSKQRATNIDYRGAALAAMLPDLVDKPLSLTLFSSSGTSQGPGHTLLGQAFLTLSIARLRPGWLPYAFISNSHLIADQMWKYPRTLFFPLCGRLDSWKFMGTPKAMFSAYAEIATRPAIVAAEVVGMALLAWVIHRGQLHHRQNFRRLLLSGKVRGDPRPSLPDGRGTRKQRGQTRPCE